MIHLYLIMATGVVHRFSPSSNLVWDTAAYDALVLRHSKVEGPVEQYLVLDDSLEPDHYFFEAWCLSADGSGIDVDMAKARAIHLAKIRRVRNKELAKKDIPWMKAMEAGDTSAQATIGTEKQVLRDLPATFDITTGVTTPAQLKGRWPAELPARE